MINWNWMLAGNKSVKNFEKYAYEGLDGLKTGYTLEAGDCFTGTAMRNGMRLITVVMGTTSKDKRFGETRKLLDYGFNNFEVKTIIQAKTELTELPLIAVKKGVQTEVSLVTSDSVQFVVSKSEPPTILIEITEADEVLRTAPIEEGTALGTAKVSYDSPTGTISKTISLITTEDVEKGNWFRRKFGIQYRYGE
jgi:D-alanyl-D-alanine carboxypeptidase (penicillin-binding protein 5/6)